MEEEIKLPLKWKSYEYIHKPKGENWFWLIASSALLLVIISIMLRNFLFALFVILAGAATILLGARKPSQISFSIEASGIKLDKRLLPYKEIKSFWINYAPPQKKEIILLSQKKLSPTIKIPLGKTDPNTARKALLKFLKEKKHEDSLTETIAEALGF